MADFIKSHSQLLHSKPIDMHKACYNREMWVLRDTLYRKYIGPLQKYKKNVAKRHLQKIIVDLYETWYFDPTLCLAVSFNNNDYTLHARYNTIKITKKTIGIIKDLIKARLLHHKAGMPAKDGYRSGPSYTSRIWPTDELIEYFLDLKFNIINILAHDIDKESIILNKKVVLPKDPGKPKSRPKNKNVPIDYCDTPKIRAMRLILACYNILLRKTHIDISTAENYYVSAFNEWGKETRCFISPNCFMHRTFINSTFNDGGRVYGGWWQKCHSTYRKDIFINGNPVVEVGYNAIHLAILYQIEGLNLYDMAVSHDLYDVIIPELDNVPESELIDYSRAELKQFKRFLIKKLTHNGISARSKTDLWTATIKAITAEEYTTNGEIHRPPSNILRTISHNLLASVFDSIKQKHQPIAHYFLSGIASRLQLIESNITMNLIEHFTALKVPILTLHDAYIVEQKWGQTLINAMQCSWMEEMSNLAANQNNKPKRSKYLERLTSHENHYDTRHLLAEPIEFNNSARDYTSGKNRLRRLGNIFNSSSQDQKRSNASIHALFENRWSKWNRDIVEIGPANAKKAVTERYQTSLKLHQDWLLEGDTEDDSPEIKDRYNSFYAGINSPLYAQWLRFKPLWMQGGVK